MRRDSLLSHPGSCPADGGHLSGQRIDQVEAAISPRQQQNAAIRTEAATVEGRCNFFQADAWQGEWQKGIVGIGGHGRFCPGVESGVSTQSLNDSRWL